MSDPTRSPGSRNDLRCRSVCAAFLAALISACGGGTPSKSPRTGANLLFITVDTLRADHLSCYGHERETSPALDALAASGVRFARAYSTAPWTRPSVASMMTGLYPKAHGAYRVRIKLGEDAITLAEVLKQRGYATAGIVSHAIISAEFGFAQGFDSYDDSEGLGHNHVSTENVTRMAIEKLDEFAAADEPFFLFLHFFDPHYNYRRHSEYGFAPEQVGRLDGRQSIGKLRGMKLTRPETKFLKDLYDEEIKFTDAGIGRVLDRLDELGLRQDTVVVLTADHGEEFVEHGWLGHTVHLYEEMLHVPLIIRAPGVEPRVVNEPVSLVSLKATLLEILRVPWKALGLQGQPFTPQLVGRAAEDPALLYAAVDFVPLADNGKTAMLRGLIGTKIKFIVDDRTGTVELYDLEADPRERKNLAAARPQRVDELRAILAERTRLAEDRPQISFDGDLSDELRAQLMALGYGAESDG